MQILVISRKLAPQDYHKKLYPIGTLDWENIYLLPRNTTLDTTYYKFQNKILHNDLFIKKISKFVKVKSPLCSFCKWRRKLLFTFSAVVYIHNPYNTYIIQFKSNCFFFFFLKSQITRSHSGFLSVSNPHNVVFL